MPTSLLTTHACPGGRAFLQDVDAVREEYVNKPEEWYTCEEQIFETLGLPYCPPSDWCC